MKKQLNATQKLNRRFLSSLLVISLITGSTEFMIMMLLNWYQKDSGYFLTSVQETSLNTLVITLISGPLLWFLVLRPLVVSITLEQEKVIQQNRKNKDLLTALDTHALVSITDEKGVIMYANEKFCKVSGYSHDELIGQDHRIINSGFHDKQFFHDLWQTISKGQIWQGIVCNRTKTGSYYWVDSNVMPFLNEKGEIKQYISIRRDITDKKATEDRLKMFKMAVDACSEMIIITDADGYIQYANPALYQSCFWTESNLMGKSISIFDSPNNPIHILETMKQALVKGESWNGRLLSRRKGRMPIAILGQATPPDPYEFWSQTSITPVLNDDGSLFGYVQILRDISELVIEEQQEQLEKEDTTARFEIADILQRDIPLIERFKKILDILFKLSALDLQRKGGIFLKLKNEEALEMFVLQGSFSDEFIEKEKKILVGSCLCGRVAVSNRLLISDDCFCDPRHDHTFTGMKSHGHFIVPLAIGDNVLGVMFLYTDPYPDRHAGRLMMLKQVGELMALAIMREQTQSSLENARDMAMQASLAKSEFLASVSHEIRTPMNGVLGMLELLGDTDMSNTQRELMETAHNSAEALLEIINAILDFSKLEAGKIEIEKIDFDLGKLIEEVASLLARRAFAKGIELSCFLPSDLHPKWVGDPMRIRQVLTNLIGNAIKFTKQGEVSITLKLLTESENQQLLHFEIRDTGIGITPTVQTRLFQPFTQADSSTSRYYGGTGLGLSICKSLVVLMGGTIGVDSEIGKGSRFWFTLPLIASVCDNTVATADFSGKRVLVVDDNATNRMILKHYLEHWGLVVGLADSAKAALDDLELTCHTDTPYDLIIQDMHMPGMDGVALAKKILEKQEYRKIPRVLLTSGTLIGEEQQHTLGLTRSLLKPVRQSQLFDAIADCFSTRKVADDLIVRPDLGLPDYHGKKMLVVEDNKVNQKVIIGLLAKFKISPMIADNGQIALDLLADHTFDLIFMDCQMPVLDGYETTAKIRLREQHTDAVRTPIVALTAHAIAGEREKCFAAGMDDYLSKPVKLDALSNMLAHWFNQQTTVFSAPERLPLLDESMVASPSCIWDTAAALRQLDGDEELLVEMIGVFLEEMPQLLSELNEACQHNNLFELARVAHAIKGSIGHFCADKLVDCASQLERAARHHQLSNYTVMVDELVAGVNDLMKNMSSINNA